MPTLVKTFSLILQQECEFNLTISLNSQDVVASLAFQEGSNKVSRGGYFTNHKRGCLT